MTPSCSPRRPGRTDLNRRNSYQALDPSGMLDFAIDFPSQVQHAARIGRSFRPSAGLRNPANIVLAGMGGSAVVGDFLSRLCQDRLPVPFSVCRDYRIPAFVGPNTLFIASSHSGNTEETLAATALARRKGARIICISTDGKIHDLARRHDLSLIATPRTDPPMPPRAALGYSLIPLVSAFGSLGLYPGADRQIREAISLLSQLRDELHPDVATRRNPAKQLAGVLFRKIPWVQGTAGIMGAAAYRWRCQFNENSKTLACSSEYPELNHNEVVGWQVSPRLAKNVVVVILHRPDDHPRNLVRVRIARDMMARRAPVHLLQAQGRSPLAQLLWTVYYGDFTSLYLAFLNRVDPASIDAINELKSRLARL